MSKIRLDRAAYLHNLSAIAGKIGDISRIILVLKDNAYSHGVDLIAPEAAKFGIGFVAVKSEVEAINISELFPNILVLSHIPTGKESKRFIYGINEFLALKEIAKGSKIHLAIDTLMHRNGLALDEIESAFDIIKERELRLLGAYTHFRSSDEISCDYFIQRQKFKEAKAKISVLCDKFGFEKPIFHSHNSAALERFAVDLKDEYVRVGMAQYGYSQFDDSLNLRPVLSLWANRVSLRKITAGGRVGYGGLFVAARDMSVATYDLGYGDGLLRYDGSGELRLRDGARLLGKMSMDSFGAEDYGKEVCVFDDARVWARFFNTIEYDVLTKLSPFIPRVWA